MLFFFYYLAGQNKQIMLEQIKNAVQQQIGKELAEKFNLSSSVVNLITDKVLEVLGVGGSGSSGFGNLMKMGTDLLQGKDLSSLVNNLPKELPNKLTETGEIDSNLAKQVTDFVTPKLQEVLKNNSDGGGLMDKLGDLF